jgi:bacterioferritin
MGTKAKEIVGVNVEELVKMLNKAYADEWLAYYQYWIGSKVAVGRMRGIISEELEEHANEELKHAGMLAKRMVILGGTPLISPQEILKESACGYEAPSDPNTKKLVEQNLKGERCAIVTYKKILDFVNGKDPITFKLVLEILEEEIKHEEDLEAILADMTTPIK